MSTLRADHLQTLDGSVTVDVEDLVTNVSLGVLPYVAAGTGAVSRSAQSKLSDVISVKDFGAKGDFATDDTAAIRNSLLAAAAYGARGAVVYMPAGVYNVSGTITIPAYVRLIGAGKASTLIRCTSAGTVVDPIVTLPNIFSGLQGIGVVYSGLQSAQGTCLISTGSNNDLRDFMVSAGYVGFQWHTGSATVCDDFQILDCKRIGLLIGQNTSGFANDLFISNFFIITLDHTNFSLGAMRVLGRVEALIVSKADFIGSTTPFTSDPGTGEGLRFSSFDGVYFDSGDTSPIFTGVNHTTFSDCWWSNRSTGATFVNCHSLTFSGAKVYNNSLYGFLFSNCHHINLSGDFALNNLSSSGSVDDIFFDATCSNLTIGPLMGFEAGATRYGLFINSGVTNYQIKDVNMTPRAAGVVSEPSAAAGRRVTGVSGYTTQTKGQGTLPASGTSVSVPHGLGVAPALKNIQMTSNGQTMTPLYVSAVDATNLVVATQTGNAGATNFTWWADMS